jgi:hypothetical protein
MTRHRRTDRLLVTRWIAVIARGATPIGRAWLPAALAFAILSSAPFEPVGSGQQASPGIPLLGLVSSDTGAYAAAKGSGVRAVKIVADWSAIEPERGRASWIALDQVVAAAVREGLTPVIVVSYTPRWASIGSGAELTRPEIYSRQPPRDVREWERFVGAAAERYRGRVAEWQMWTQLGLPLFRGTGSEYLALLQAARARIRAVDPNARVAMATPTGVDLTFLLRAAQDAPGAFDAVALAPQGFAPEALLRPLAILGRRLKAAGKAIWLDWMPDGSLPADRTAGAGARVLAVAQATGIERVFLTDPTHIGPEMRRAAAVLLSRPFAGYLVRDPDVYALVFGTAAEATVVAWATVEGRFIEVPAPSPPRVTTLDGQPVLIEAREGRTFARLSLAPVVATGVAPSLVDEARATAGARGPLLPVVSPDRDYSRAIEVSARLGRIGEEKGLYNLPYRGRRNGAVEPVEIAGAEAVQTSIVRQVIYVYFDIDDSFMYFAEGRTPIEITVEVLGARGPRQVGFNLLYDSTGGYRFTPWQWVDASDGWVTHTVRLTDASMANTWGWDFAINTAGNRSEDLTIRAVAVRKGAP